MYNLLQLEIDMINKDIVNGTTYQYKFLQSTIEITVMGTKDCATYFLRGKMYMNNSQEYENHYNSEMYFIDEHYNIIDIENDLQIMIGNLLKRYCEGDDGAEF